MHKTIRLNTQLVKDCKRNKAKAQMQLYDMYCQAMFKIAFRYVKDEHIAEDVMQDAFIKVFKNIKSYKGEVTIGAWIKKIVINQSLDYLKKRQIELVSIDETQLQIADDNWNVNEKTNVKVVYRLINNLPEKYKVVLSLYLIEGYDHQEIAQVLNITEVASRSQLMRGKNKLKQQLKELNYA
ncbi:MAG TPA: sigma-70 family RNA polymerase sigma factor [Flavobacteriaceae bacterium]|nr:sigma-70 family RNA polymerase sigma factor [Flavobacteriaceae bacterium]